MTWIGAWFVAVVSVTLLALGGAHVGDGRSPTRLPSALDQQWSAGNERELRREVVSTSVSEREGFYVGFFPNPAREKVTFIAREICWCQVRAIRIRIFNMSGTLVLTKESESQLLDLDVGSPAGSDLSDGIYVVRSELLIGETWRLAGLEKLAVLR
jgi:hypothetical protein